MKTECTHCHAQFNAPDNAVGQKARCPKCKNPFVIASVKPVLPTAVPNPAEQEELASPPPVHASVSRVQPVPANTTQIEHKIIQNVHVHQQSAKRTSGMGIAALVLGIIACLTCWIPFLGLLGAPLAALGLLFGIIGIILSLISRRSSVGLSLAGSIVCLVSLMICGTITGVTTTAIGQAVNSVEENMNKPVSPTSVQSQKSIVLPVAPKSKTEKPSTQTHAVPAQPTQKQAEKKEVQDDILKVADQQIFGIRLGETTGSLSNRTKVVKSDYTFKDEDHPGIIWQVQSVNPSVKELLITTFNDEIYEIEVRFADASLANYATIKEQIENKYKSKDSSGLSGAMLSEGTFDTIIDGLKVRIKLNHDIGYDGNVLTLTYRYEALYDSVYQEIQNRKASKVSRDL